MNHTTDSTTKTRRRSLIWSPLAAGLVMTLMLTGTYASEVQTASIDALGPLGPTSWPTWRGDGTSLSTDTGLELVEDPRTIRKVWTSEIRDIPWAWPGGTGRSRLKWTGGYGGPLVVGGKVFIAWWMPSGEVVDEKIFEKVKEKDPRRERWLVDADELMACLDARTGKTLWKARMPGTGWNHQEQNHCALYFPVVSDGVVCFNGNGGYLYCLSVDDGSLRWKARIGKIADKVDKFKQRGEIWSPRVHAGQPGWNKHNFNISPAIVDGVVACNDQSGRKGHSGMVAFDLATGEELWRVPDCMSVVVSNPMVWRHGGRNYLIAAGARRAVCVVPKTGEIVWQIDPVEEAEPLQDYETLAARHGKVAPPILVSAHQCNTAVAGDVLILPSNAYFRKMSKKVPVTPWMVGHRAFRMTPQGATQMWQQSRWWCQASHSATVVYKDLAVLQTAKKHGKGSAMYLVDLATGERLGELGGVGRGEQQGIVGDGWAFYGRRRVRLDRKNFKDDRLPVRYESYTSTFYANGFLFTRGPVDDAPKTKKGQPYPNINAVHCYDLRKQ